MAYVEVEPLKINSWESAEKIFQWYKYCDQEQESQNFYLKINTENLSNLSIFLFTEPDATTPSTFVNGFTIGSAQSPNSKNVTFGRNENKIVWNLDFNMYKNDDNYLYCAYNSIHAFAKYWAFFVEFPPVPTPLNIQVIATETP